MKTIRELLVWFSKQKSGAKLFLGGLGLVLVFGICILLSAIFTRPQQQQSPLITATYKGADSILFTTWTPGPTTSTPIPTNSAIPNGSQTVTPTLFATSTNTPTATEAPLPTGLPTRSFETATVVRLQATLSRGTAGVLLIIIYVDKELEFVDIQNAGNPPVNLNGWALVSETGNQICNLKGIIQPKQILRIWAGTGQVGISCGFKRTIWLDKESDPAVLYNPKGEEVSRYPKP